MTNEKLNKDTNDKISFVCFIIPEFALAYKMNVQKAFCVQKVNECITNQFYLDF